MTAVRLGLRANARQFALLVALNSLVGAMVGLERSVVPLLGEQEFGVASHGAILLFVVAFGAAKAVTNLVAGGLAARAGRKRLLVAGWLLALPVPLLVAFAPGWELVIVANVFLGASQGLAWSMTVVMKIDLVGPRRRGLALGLNESAGYIGLALAAFATGAAAGSLAPRTAVWAGAVLVAVTGLVLSAVFVEDTQAHVTAEAASDGRARTTTRAPSPFRTTLGHPVLRACSQAGFVNNLNDALAWGLVPLYLAAHGATVGEVGLVAAVYPGVWGAGQLVTGWLSDHVGRKPLIVAGMLAQAAALAALPAGAGSLPTAVAAAALLGAGTALVYPALLAAVSDVARPVERAALVGVYRFWRDCGLVAGALLGGLVADALGAAAAIELVALLTAASGIGVAASAWRRTVSAADPSAGPMGPIGTPG